MIGGYVEWGQKLHRKARERSGKPARCRKCGLRVPHYYVSEHVPGVSVQDFEMVPATHHCERPATRWGRFTRWFTTSWIYSMVSSEDPKTTNKFVVGLAMWTLIAVVGASTTGQVLWWEIVLYWIAIALSCLSATAYLHAWVKHGNLGHLGSIVLWGFVSISLVFQLMG